MNLKIDLPLDRLKKYYIDENHTQKECCEFFNISLNALQRRINLYNLKKDQQSINNKRKDTCYQKYGVEYVGQAQQFQEKAQDTMLKRYGVKGAAGLLEVQKTIKQNNLSKYGVDHPMKSIKGKEHFKKIMEQKYGVSNPSQYSDFQQKKKDSCLQHYGVENPSQSEEIKRKKEKTNLKHYGVECNLTLDSTKEQIRQTCIQKYGMPCPPVSKYKIDGISFDSSWEAALYIYARDHHEEIKRCPTRIFYKYEGKDHYTVPDFLYKGELIEIKGDHFLKDGSLINIYNRDNDGQSKAKYEAAVRHGVKFWYEKDIRFALDYVKKQYSSDFLEQYKKK